MIAPSKALPLPWQARYSSASIAAAIVVAASLSEALERWRSEGVQQADLIVFLKTGMEVLEKVGCPHEVNPIVFLHGYLLYLPSIE